MTRHADPSRGTVIDMPNPRHTPMRTIRIAEDLWQQALATAAANEESVSEVVRRALVNYVRRNK
jgi:hypothetical protein